MQAPGGPEEDTTGGFAHGGWMEPVFEEAVGHQVDPLFAGDFDLLLGRRTHDIFAAYWPFMPDGDPIAAPVEGQPVSRAGFPRRRARRARRAR